MIQITDKRDCCGCTACENVCGHSAISLQPDELGFLYPVVDVEKCVDCGLCDKVCQFHNDYCRYDNFDAPLIFGARHKDPYELNRSQSGAASWAIIQKFTANGGIVYGVGFDNPAHIIHKRATSIEECEEFRGSKYVQSDLRRVFPKVRKDLIAGKKVLFIGTGCQVAGLKSYIPRKLHENLITVDLVCHATPAPAVWKSYLDYLEKKYHSKVVHADFRDKAFGWHSHKECITFENGGKEVSENYFWLFYNHLTIRPSCTNCHYTNFSRVSDITISDFWGWEKYYDEWNDNKGVSLIMINSDKGRIFIDCDINLDMIESDEAKCSQPQLRHPIAPNPEYNEAVRIFVKKGYKGLAVKYGFAPGRAYYRKRWIGVKSKVYGVLSKIKRKFV